MLGKKKYRGVKIDETYDEGITLVHLGFSIETENMLDWNFGYTCYMPRRIYVEGLSTGCPKKTYVFNDLGDVAFDEGRPNAYRITESIYFNGSDVLPICKSAECTKLLAIPTVTK
jgi:hypothetical protein